MPGSSCRADPRHAIQPADAALLAVGRHQRELPLRLPRADAMSAGDATGAVRPGRHLDRQRARPGRRGQRDARCAWPAAAAAGERCARWSAPARAAWSARPSASARATTAFEALRDEFLDRYEARMLAQTTRLRRHGAGARPRWTPPALPWGIVTNKAARFTEPHRRMGWAWTARAAVVVSGDTTPHTKPHPAAAAARRRAGWASTPAAASTSATTSRRAGRPRRRHDHAGCRLGLPRPGRADRRLGRRRRARRAGRALALAATGLNYCA